MDHSGSLLHQKYHPQISAGLLSRKSTIGSPSLSGAPPGSGFRSGYLRIRWWAALKLDPGKCFFENRHTGGLRTHLTLANMEKYQNQYNVGTGNHDNGDEGC